MACSKIDPQLSLINSDSNSPGDSKEVTYRLDAVETSFPVLASGYAASVGVATGSPYGVRIEATALSRPYVKTSLGYVVLWDSEGSQEFEDDLIAPGGFSP